MYINLGIYKVYLNITNLMMGVCCYLQN